MLNKNVKKVLIEREINRQYTAFVRPIIESQMQLDVAEEENLVGTVLAFLATEEEEEEEDGK